MDIMELGALGEFVGSIGVIATLVYLAIQVRQNTLTMQRSEDVHRTTVETEINLRYHDWRRDLYTNPELMRIFHEGSMAPESLNETEWLQFAYLTNSLFLTLCEQNRLVDSLLVDRRSPNEALLRDIFRYPGIRASWDKGANYDLDWADAVEDIYRTTNACTPDELAQEPSPWLRVPSRHAN